MLFSFKIIDLRKVNLRKLNYIIHIIPILITNSINHSDTTSKKHYSCHFNIHVWLQLALCFRTNKPSSSVYNFHLNFVLLYLVYFMKLCMYISQYVSVHKSNQNTTIVTLHSCLTAINAHHAFAWISFHLL